MRKIYLFVIVILIGLSVKSQIIIVKEDLPLTYKSILVKAEKEWDGNYEMQQYVVKTQCDALSGYMELNSNYGGIPAENYNKIAIAALKRWCEKDFVQCINDNKESLDAKFACMDANWKMVQFEIESQIKAYNELHQ